MLQEKVEILWNKEVGGLYYRLGLKCEEGFADTKPGQFAMVRISDSYNPLLRRPFSIHRLIEENGNVRGFEILFKVVGKGTTILSGLREGGFVDVLGPLGRGFVIPENFQSTFIVAGGIGVAPLFFLASDLMRAGVDSSKIQMFIGGRSKEDLLCIDEIKAMGFPVHISTDDGSLGEKALVTEIVKNKLTNTRPDMIFACGPSPMMKAVAGIAEKENISCQVSLETMMACGMGACLGCAVEKKESSDKYLHTCLDGPVFDAAILKI